MGQELWNDVERYLADLFAPEDAALQRVLNSTRDAGLPEIQVSPTDGKLLHVLALIQGATTILEIGTLAGYSTIWLARALPAGGRVVTLEVDPEHARVAEANLAAAGLSDQVEVRVGPALETLPKLQQEGLRFDMVFIDADKDAYPEYLEWSLKLALPGALIVADNVVRQGEVVDAGSDDPSVQGTRRFNQALAREQRVTAAIVQTVGSKGHDGMAIARVR